ncbi:MAG: N-acetylmuramoyl-L-alanine amidase [Rickettsiales bacterium]|jgi:N-acetylmuramoyl-L-alanine amidase|nr:N-acetylmuramoyl-L-alanine amidase [Rickettsiales bacterium]
MRKIILLLLCVNTLYANIVSNIRLNTGKYTERIVIDNSTKINYNPFLLKNPDRLVIDLQSTENYNVKAPSFASNEVVDSLRIGKFSNTDSRIVFDLNIKPKSIKDFYLKPDKNNKYHRIVIDLEFEKEEKKDKIETLIDDLNTKRIEEPKKTKTKKESKLTSIPKTKPVIIIDAGHGGKDPGAQGQRGTKEKILTLIYAKSLKEILDKTGLYSVYLTRNNDTYIELMDRIAFARKRKGDLFISIHADATTNRNAKGLSIYTLSQTASDTRTAQLAQKENKSDIISGADLYGEYQDTINTLVDLSRVKAMNDSKKFAGYLEQELKKRNVRSLSSNMRKFANFAVLTGANTASILLEIGFISNNNEERMIRSASYRDKIVEALAETIKKYFKK